MFVWQLVQLSNVNLDNIYVWPSLGQDPPLEYYKPFSRWRITALFLM
jgi:hypothetical protein